MPRPRYWRLIAGKEEINSCGPDYLNFGTVREILGPADDDGWPGFLWARGVGVGYRFLIRKEDEESARMREMSSRFVPGLLGFRDPWSLWDWWEDVVTSPGAYVGLYEADWEKQLEEEAGFAVVFRPHRLVGLWWGRKWLRLLKTGAFDR